ncbi:MAG TPA: hypothetical protein VFJ02_05840 [Vicinamibacterales bacterium]|nr:hypothetical protein [Vicinamibacterales bacterium]
MIAPRGSSADASFALTKWYLDCVADDGRVAICYWASLSWRRLSLVWQGLTVYESGCPPVEQSAIGGSGPPTNDEGRISWQSPKLGATVMAEGRQPAFGLRLFEEHSQYVDWRCEAPVAHVTIDAAGQAPIHGLGYVEQLTLTIPPWRLPLDEIRWGRWIDRDATRSIVWIDWRGPAPQCWTFVDGVRAPRAAVGDDRVTAGAVVLALDPPRTLSCRALDRVIARIPGLRAVVPPLLLAWHETKWFSRGVVCRAAEAPVAGSVIYERVVVG